MWGGSEWGRGGGTEGFHREGREEREVEAKGWGGAFTIPEILAVEVYCGVEDIDLSCIDGFLKDCTRIRWGG
jgi:hypothetical protein